MEHKQMITVETTILLPVADCWEAWTMPADIMQWNNPSDDWRTPKVEIDLKNGGRFLYRMELKDGSFGFDHSGNYDKVIVNELIEYTVSDGRKSIITFQENANGTTLTETFEPEAETPVDVQKTFVQGVLNNFKNYVESKPK